GGRGRAPPARNRGVALGPVQPGELVNFLTRLSGLDYGAYARGYHVEGVNAGEVCVTPAGAQSATTIGATAGSASASRTSGDSPWRWLAPLLLGLLLLCLLALLLTSRRRDDFILQPKLHTPIVTTLPPPRNVPTPYACS